jgi:erythromycin esterase-like protein
VGLTYRHCERWWRAARLLGISETQREAVGSVPSPEGVLSLGQALREGYSDAYFALCLEFNQGSYQMRAVGPDGLLAGFQNATIGPALAESLPWYLSRAGIDACFVSLRTPAVDPLVARWLDTPLKEHRIAWVYGEPSSFYEPVTPRQAYDGLVFAEQSTPAHPTATAREKAARREGQ